MPDIILHNYVLSPFSEKIRLLLGYCDLDWYSVTVSSALPRPELVQLTGGYRKIPVLQIGADIYCDTKLIARKLAEISDHAELFPADQLNDVLTLCEYADGRFFQFIITASLRFRTLANLKQHMGLGEGLKLVWDRIRMGTTDKMPKAGPGRARSEMHTFLPKLNARVVEGFCFGDTPTIADFCLYHPLYLTEVLGGAGLIDGYPAIGEWISRMQAFGHGRLRQMSSQASLEVAAQYEPDMPAAYVADLPGRLSLGDRVTISPDDYGLAPTTGELIAATEYDWTLKRETEDCGALHVHFPKKGFCISASV